MTHTKDEALDKALEAAYLAGFNASGEGYNFEHPFQRHNAHPEQDAGWVKGRDNKLSAIKRYAAMLHTPPAPVPLTDEQARDWFAGMPEEYRKEAWRVATQPAQPAVPEPVAWSDAKQAELNDWFLSLPAGRQAVLLEDKWMLAGAAFLAGKSTPPAPVPLTDEQREEIAKGWRGRNWSVGDIIDATEAAKKGNT